MSEREPITILSSSTENNPELEFDYEVYPLGISPSQGALVGVEQRMGPGVHAGAGSLSPPSAGAGSLSLPSFDPVPSARAILPCLLRHVLIKGGLEKAVVLACASETR